MTAFRLFKLPAKPPPPPIGSTRPNRRTVTVMPWPDWSSTLAGIAQRYYGNSARWTDIYNANRNHIVNPNHLIIGQTLVVP